MKSIERLDKNPYSLGLASVFVASHPPFDRFEFGPTVKTLFHQINNETHLILAENDRIVGYLGWLKTTEDIAAAWLDGEAALNYAKGGNVAAVTIFVVNDPKDTIRMIKAAKLAEPDSHVYWKRYYTDGRPPSPRVVRKTGE